MTTKTQAILDAAAAFQAATTEMLAANTGRKSASESLRAADVRVAQARDSLEAAERALAAASMMDGDDLDFIFPSNVVRLKSGGPWMTVESVSDSSAMCIWAIGEEMQRRPFNVTVLEKSLQG